MELLKVGGKLSYSTCSLNQLLKKHNYTEEENEIYNKINHEFRKNTFSDEIVNKFASQEKRDSIVEKFTYKNSQEKYKGERIIFEEDKKKYKKRHGFGYYYDKVSKTRFIGLFDNDEYKKGYLDLKGEKIFNGEFSSDQESFNGLYLNDDQYENSLYIWLGETNLKQKTFKGIFIKLQKESISLYIGELKDQKKIPKMQS